MTPKRYRESEPEQRTMDVAAISHHVAVITRYDICTHLADHHRARSQTTGAASAASIPASACLKSTDGISCLSCTDQPVLSATASCPLPSTLAPVSLRLVQMSVPPFGIVLRFLQCASQVLFDLAHDLLLCGLCSTCGAHVCRLALCCPRPVSYTHLTLPTKRIV